MNARLFGCLVLALVVVGCQGPSADPNRPKTTPAGGTVTYNGQPVEGATVTLFATSGQARGAVATTDASGKFTFTTFEAGDGAIPGSFKVMISKTILEPPKENTPPGPGGEPPSGTPKDLVPAKYKDANQSGLTAEVKEGGENSFEFALTD
jgi:hypothetical protein